LGTPSAGVMTNMTGAVSASIGNDQIDSQHYAAGSIDNEHLADDAVGSDELANDAVTADKLADSINTDIATGVTANTTANAALPKAGGTMSGTIYSSRSTTDTGAPTTSYTDARYRLIVSNPQLTNYAEYGIGFASYSNNVCASISSDTHYNTQYESGLRFQTRDDGSGGLREALKLLPDKSATFASGVRFSGDTAAANTLDDYEEGTFAPSIKGSTTAGTWTGGVANSGNYTKIGDTVIYVFSLHGSLSGATGSYGLFTLPIVPKSGTKTALHFGYVSNSNINTIWSTAYGDGPIDTLYMTYKATSTGGVTYHAPSHFSASVHYMGFTSYLAA